MKIKGGKEKEKGRKETGKSEKKKEDKEEEQTKKMSKKVEVTGMKIGRINNLNQQSQDLKLTYNIPGPVSEAVVRDADSPALHDELAEAIFS